MVIYIRGRAAQVRAEHKHTARERSACKAASATIAMISTD